MLSRRACRASVREGGGGLGGGISVVNRRACCVLPVIVRDACVIKRDGLSSHL
jgi:hypothetical protein